MAAINATARIRRIATARRVRAGLSRSSLSGTRAKYALWPCIRCLADRRWLRRQSLPKTLSYHVSVTGSCAAKVGRRGSGDAGRCVLGARAMASHPTPHLLHVVLVH